MKKKTLVYLVIILVLLLVLLLSCFWLYLRTQNNDFTLFKGGKTSVEKTEKTPKMKKSRESRKSQKNKIKEEESPVFLEEEEVKEERTNSYSTKELSLSEFSLSKKARSSIADCVQNWTQEIGSYSSESAFFDDLNLYLDKVSYASADISNPIVFVFSPEYQGICTIGFCDEVCNWKQVYGYIGVFSEKGDLLCATGDYGHQQFDIQLSANEVYYIVLCKMYQNEFDTDVNFRIMQNIKSNF
ncbi:MAG: hypothetical protein K5839_06615 [Treponemataceae bacterium]|nr:hypothetical protein [Treponemataceae bacterium]